MTGLARQNGETRLARPAGGFSRWDPWSEFNRIRQEMDGLFNGFLAGYPTPAPAARAWTPPVDLYETEEDLVLNCYLPGLTREDIQLEVLGDSIHLRGESRPQLPENATVHFAQGGAGRFAVRYTLPVEVKRDEVRATFRNGVLEVRMPKAEAAKPRSVEVQIEG